MDTRRDPLTMPPLPWRVGELARRTRLSVRTLHHRGDLTLLVPSHRSPAGHPLYTAADISPLQRLGEQRIQDAQNEWAELVDDVRTAMARGTDPRSVAGQQLAERWNGLVGEFTGGDPGIERSLRSIYQAEPQAVVTPIGVDHRDVY